MLANICNISNERKLAIKESHVLKPLSGLFTLTGQFFMAEIFFILLLDYSINLLQFGAMKSNQLTQLKKSGIHNFGLTAKQDIPADTRIIEYVGKRITHKQADQHLDENPDDCVYMFAINKRYVIDGDVDYNLAKYINHSCDPNCYSDIINNQIWIFALRDIKKGEELTYDYGFQRVGWEQRPCLCGIDDCFGFVVSNEHWSSIRKTKRYQALSKELIEL